MVRREEGKSVGVVFLMRSFGVYELYTVGYISLGLYTVGVVWPVLRINGLER